MTLIEMLRLKADELERTHVAGSSIVMLMRDAAEQLAKVAK